MTSILESEFCEQEEIYRLLNSTGGNSTDRWIFYNLKHRNIKVFFNVFEIITCVFIQTAKQIKT